MRSRISLTFAGAPPIRVSPNLRRSFALGHFVVPLRVRAKLSLGRVSFRQGCVKVGDIGSRNQDYRRCEGRLLGFVYVVRMESISSPTP